MKISGETERYRKQRKRKTQLPKSTEKAMNTKFIVAGAAIFVSGFVSGLMIGMAI